MLSRNHSGHSPFSFHQVEFFSIIFFQKGTGKHTIDFIDYECKKGTLLTVRKDQIHKFSNSNLDGILMIFTFDFLGNFFTKEESYKSLLLFNEFLNSPKLQPSQTSMIKISFDKIEQKVSTISVTNINGQLVKTINFTNDIIDISDLNPGNYFVEIETKAGILTKSLVKQ